MALRRLGLVMVISVALTLSAAMVGAQDATYTVRGGDTLAAIAARYNVSLDALMVANGLTNPNVVFAGQVLALPTGAASAFGTGGPTTGQAPATVSVLRANNAATNLPTATVEPGDNLTILANRYNVTVEELVAVNNFANANLIGRGDVIYLPLSAQIPPAAPTVATVPAAPTVSESGGGTEVAAPLPPVPTTSAANIYTVRVGDMISLLALEWNTSEAAIIAANPDINPSRIFPGDELIVP